MALNEQWNTLGQHVFKPVAHFKYEEKRGHQMFSKNGDINEKTPEALPPDEIRVHLAKSSEKSIRVKSVNAICERKQDH